MLKRKIASLLIIALCTTTFVGCSNKVNGIENNKANSVESTNNSNKVKNSDFTFNDNEDFYINWKSQSYKTVNLNNGAVAINSSGIYELTGTLKDGSITVDVDKKNDSGIIYLVLNNANLSSSTEAPINIISGNKVVILLENGTTNTINQGSNIKVDDSNNPSAAIFSKTDLTITGPGKLNVTTQFNDGITSKDILKITDGVININSKGDGIVGKDALLIKSADITIDSGKDGLRATNEEDENMGAIIIDSGKFNIKANNDGIQGVNLVEVNGGDFNITTGGGYTTANQTNNGMNGNGMMPGMGGMRPGSNMNTATQTQTNTESNKGIKSTNLITITDGRFNISSKDDAIHANGDVYIGKGSFVIESGDDGIHADTTVTINGGDINIKNCYEGIEGKIIEIDKAKININSSDDGINAGDSGGLINIKGGEIFISSLGDGLDSNKDINMSGGKVIVEGPKSAPDVAVDYDGSFKITGGTLIASGPAGMAQTSQGTQGSMLMYFNSVQAAGKKVTIKDSKGNTIIEVTPSKQYSTIAISDAQLKALGTYTLYSDNKEVVTFTTKEEVSYVDESGLTTNKYSGGGGQGGMKGGQGGTNTRPQR